MGKRVQHFSLSHDDGVDDYGDGDSNPSMDADSADGDENDDGDNAGDQTQRNQQLSHSRLPESIAAYQISSGSVSVRRSGFATC